MPKFSIIIPTIGRSEMFKNCLNSIYQNSKDFEIIVINNGVPAISSDQFILIQNKENVGFPIAVNQGIEKATGEIIVILNNDTLVTPGWLDHLADHLKYADIVGPVSNNVSGIQKIDSFNFASVGQLNSFAQSIYEKNKLQSTPHHRAVFFCVAIKREVFDKIGLLDEQFSPGNFEDDDFCLRAVDMGFRLVIARDVFIYHIGNATHKALNIDYQNLLNINREKFEKKWPPAKYQELVKKTSEVKTEISLKNDDSLALVMCVKNEAKGLRHAVDSVKSVCDEIIIAVDDSSTDDTLLIARQLTPNVKTFKWGDDFSAMRNFAHSGVKSDWILFLDGHEILKKPENIKKHLLSLKNGVLSRVKMEDGQSFPACRIYRNGCFFTGAIHEQLNCNSLETAEDFLIEHHRLDYQDQKSSAEREKQRDDQSSRLLVEAVKNNPKNVRALFHLALFCQSKNDFKNSLKYQKKYLKCADKEGGRWFMYYNMALSFLAQKKYFRCWLATCEAVNINPYRWEICEMRGMLFYSQKQWQKAAEYFVESFNENKGNVDFLPKQKNSAMTWNYIGDCFFNLGEYWKAGEAFKAAFDHCPDPAFKDLLGRRRDLMFEMSKSGK